MSDTEQPVEWKKRFRDFRCAMDWSQADLAEHAGVTRGWVGMVESGSIAEPGGKRLNAVARTFGFTDGEQMRRWPHARPPAAAGALPAPNEADLRATIRDVVREEVAAAGAAALPGLPVAFRATGDVVPVPIYAAASAGRDHGQRLRGRTLELPAGEVGRRTLGAVLVRGRCMWPFLVPGDLLVYEVVPDDAIRDGDLVVVTLLDDGEDGAYQIKHLHWRVGEVRLTARDGTERVVPYDRVKIEGRFWRQIRETAPPMES